MARSDNNATVPALGVYGQNSAPTFADDLTGLADDTAQILAAEVADLASLPSTGNWVNRIIWVDSEGEPRWWNGTAWVGPLNDTGWVDLPLASGFSANTRTPQLRRKGSRVIFRGDVKKTSGSFDTNGVITIVATGAIPAGMRPVSIENRFIAGSSQASSVRAYADSNGSMTIVTGSVSPAYVDLGGLFYEID